MYAGLQDQYLMLWYLLQPSHIKDATLLEKKSRNLKEQLTVTNMKVISPFYWQWSPTSCTLVSCHMLFMTKHSLYLINFQCTWQQGLIKLFPNLNSRNTTTWQEYPQLKYNVATNSKNDQRQIKNNNTTTYPQSLTFS